MLTLPFYAGFKCGCPPSSHSRESLVEAARLQLPAMSVAESDVDTVPTQAILPLSQEWVAVGSNEGDAGAEASEPVARRRRLCVKQPRPPAFVAAASR